MKKALPFPNDLRCERGFVVFTLVLLPAVLVLAFGAYHLNTQILQERELQTVCRDRLLATQKEAARGITRLLALNAPLRAIKIEHAITYQAWVTAVAMSRPDAIGIRMRLNAIEKKREALRIRQQRLIEGGRSRLARDLGRLRIELDRRVRERRNRTATGQLEAQFRFPFARGWALIPQGAPYPEYHLAPDFPERQAVRVDWNWRFSPTEGVQEWIPWNARKKLRCGATLTRRLESRIHEDRFSLSSW